MKRFKNNKLLTILLSLLPYLTVFLFGLFSPSDPDLGWHLKYGEYFFQHGTVLRDNTFAALMPAYQWANTSWLTDVLTYGVYSFGGFLGLTLLGSLAVTATFFFFSRVARLTLWDQAFLFPILLYLEQPVNAISFRGQQLSLLFIGILFYLISFYPKNKKVFLLIIPLFLLWANLHGEFIFGLALFGIWIGLYFFQNLYDNFSSLRATKGARQSPALRESLTGLLRRFTPRNDGILIGVFLLSTLATIINPFGIGIHTAAISHFGSPLLKNIAEYLPFDLLSTPWWNQLIIGIGLTLGFIFLFFKGKLNDRIPILGVALVVYVLSFGVRRFAWPAYYMILPMLTPLAAFFRPDSKKITQLMTILFVSVLFGIALYSRIPFTKYIQYDWDAYCQTFSVKCSPESVTFMIDHNLTKNVYTLYSWGGWLIWNYPEIKPVIDGRMHLWKEATGFSGFVYYYAIEQNFKDIDKSTYDIVLMSPDKPVYDRLVVLVKQGKWKQVYKDDFAGVFVRNK